MHFLSCCSYSFSDTSSTTTSIKLESIGNNGTDLFYPVVGGGHLAVRLEFRNHHPNHNRRKKKMKPYAFLTLVVLIIAFLCVVTAVEAPRKPRGETTYVLPQVEEMETNPNPFSF
jgi:hypothetical protein